MDQWGRGKRGRRSGGRGIGDRSFGRGDGGGRGIGWQQDDRRRPAVNNGRVWGVGQQGDRRVRRLFGDCGDGEIGARAGRHDANSLLFHLERREIMMTRQYHHRRPYQMTTAAHVKKEAFTLRMTGNTKFFLIIALLCFLFFAKVYLPPSDVHDGTAVDRIG